MHPSDMIVEFIARQHNAGKVPTNLLIAAQESRDEMLFWSEFEIAEKYYDAQDALQGAWILAGGDPYDIPSF